MKNYSYNGNIFLFVVVTKHGQLPGALHWRARRAMAEDLVEDYRNARSDDERCQMLLIFGVDDAHQQDAMRLFAPSESAAADNEKPSENDPAQNIETETDRSQVSVNRKQNRIDGIIAGIVSGLIVGLVLFYWPDILSFFTNLLQKLSPP